MCGIVGYIGEQEAAPILLDGLKRLEYRGYDSSGLAVLDGRKIRVIKRVGKLQNLKAALEQDSVVGSVGLGHTRWATHGKPNGANAHPHIDCSLSIVVVHNGIIENYRPLRERLSKEGHQFSSETDTEVVAHLIEKHLNGNLEDAVRQALLEVEGSYALGIISKTDPEKIIGVRHGSPLVVGLGKGEFFLASDMPALLPYTKEEVVLDDGELVVLSRRGVRVEGLRDRRSLSKKVHRISWDLSQAEKAGYPHFMLKEIHEQPDAIRNTLAGRIHPSGTEVMLPDVSDSLLLRPERIMIVACGTSYHAALVGKHFIESLAKVPVEADIASEFRYRHPLINEKTLTIAITQSGETADTLAAMKEAAERGSPVMTICNVVGSSATRQAQGVIYTQAGPEIGVASTKAFTTQLIALLLLALYLGERRGTITKYYVEKILAALKELPDRLSAVLAQEKEMARWADLFWEKRDFLYLGRGISYPIALEGALKLKEISYIHAEAYPAGEMKHGPIALIDKEMPVVMLASQGPLYRKVMSNLEEVKSRDGIVMALVTEGDPEISKKADHVFHLPPVDELFLPVLQVIPLQLLAYFMAVRRGCDVDQPRNLAKSVTVE
jgi:glucosamine--fructose-6-phosphate aminotransferase (isomerizing)